MLTKFQRISVQNPGSKRGMGRGQESGDSNQLTVVSIQKKSQDQQRVTAFDLQLLAFDL